MKKFITAPFIQRRQLASDSKPVKLKRRDKTASPVELLNAATFFPCKPSASALRFSVTNSWRFKLLYDGDCPLCQREARFLQRRNRHGRLAFEDIAATGFDPKIYHTTRAELMGVIHGVFPDGRIVKKMAVFREAYRAIGLGWLLAPTGWLGLRWLFDRGYEWFARHRMTIGKWFGRNCDLA